MIALSLSVIGLVALFGQRELISGWFSLGQLILFGAPIVLSFITAERTQNTRKALGYGFLIGLVAAIPLILLAVVATSFNIRQFLFNVSPDLIELILFKQSVPVGSLILLLTMGFVGLLTAGLRSLPDEYREPILNGIAGC